MNNPDDLFAEVRRLMRHLYDPISLRLSPLASHVSQEYGGRAGAENRAMLLRQILIEAVETLSPGGNVPLRSDEWRPYRVVRGRYVDQRSMESLAEEMGLSERQLRRELREGTLAISQAIGSRIGQSLAKPPSDDEGLADAVRDLSDTVESVNACAEIRATERLVTPLARERGTVFGENHLAESMIVWANRVLLRQVLLALYAWLIDSLGATHVESRIDRMGASVRIQWLAAYSDQGVGAASADGLVPDELLKALGAKLGLICERGICRLELDLVSTPAVSILLVDDNPSLHNLVRRYLVGLPYSLASAYDAVSGLSLARTQQPDLLVVDIMMPERDGWELLRMLKGDPATMDIPVVICSVLEQKSLAESLDAAGYLTKPVTQSALLGLLHSLDLGRSP